MKAAEVRAEAREALRGKWGKAILAGLIYCVITIALAYLLELIPFVGTVINYIISIPLSFAIVATFMKITRGEEFGYFDFINIAIELFGKCWGVIGHTLLKMIVPIICIIVSIVLLSAGTGMTAVNAFTGGSSSSTGLILAVVGMIAYIISIIWATIKGLSYSLIEPILIDNPDMNTKDVVEKSEALMDGNKGKLFCLYLSFIGWAILSVITFGIGVIWLLPYMMVSEIIFYKKLIGNNKSSEENIEE